MDYKLKPEDQKPQDFPSDSAYLQGLLCKYDNVSVPPPPAHKEATFVTQNTTTTAESNINNINNNNNKEMFTVSPFWHQSVHLQTAFFFFSHSVACVFHL